MTINSFIDVRVYRRRRTYQNMGFWESYTGGRRSGRNSFPILRSLRAGALVYVARLCVASALRHRHPAADQRAAKDAERAAVPQGVRGHGDDRTDQEGLLSDAQAGQRR